MGEMIKLTAADGHRLEAYLARPVGKPRGGLLVLQEIFGVNRHIRQVTDSFAALGYLALAPALLDRARPGVDIAYDRLQEARDLVMSLDRTNTVADMRAGVLAVREAGKVGAVGYCWGGALADLAACQCEIEAAVSYYGRHTATWLELKPKCPVMYHFGKLDPFIPAEAVEAIRAGRPGGIFHVYEEAGHGFNCDERHEYHAASARQAMERTLQFLRRYVG